MTCFCGRHTFLVALPTSRNKFGLINIYRAILLWKQILNATTVATSDCNVLIIQNKDRYEFLKFWLYMTMYIF